ncbi:hypothetical protein BSLG_005938 [Batrachochytrium salamandrivorans]|nr:hypothetical protein BSLG_005938 [Batrachochytrium salamandrivorans]
MAALVTQAMTILKHTRPSIHDKWSNLSMYHVSPDQDTHAGQSASTHWLLARFLITIGLHLKLPYLVPLRLRPSVALQQRPPFRLPVPAALKLTNMFRIYIAKQTYRLHIQSASISKSFPTSGALDGLHHYPSMNTLKISPHSPPSFDRPSLPSQSMTCRYADNTINATLPALAASARPDSMPLSNSYTPPLSATIISAPPYQVISSVRA